MARSHLPAVRETVLIFLLITGCATVWLLPWFAWGSFEPWDASLKLYPVAMLVLGCLFALLSRLPARRIVPAAWIAGVLGQSVGACLIPGDRSWVPFGLLAISASSCLLLPGALAGLELSRTPIYPMSHFRGAFSTLLLILFVSATILVVVLCGLLIFAVLGGVGTSEARGPSLRSLIFIASYALTVIAALYAYSSKLRLWPLIALMIGGVAGVIVLFGPL